MKRRRILAVLGGILTVGGCLESDDDPGETRSDDRDSGVDREANLSHLQSLLPNETESGTADIPTETEVEGPTLADRIEAQEPVQAEPDQPDPELVSMVASQPRLVSTDHTAIGGTDEFSATIQNTGDDGDVQVRLVWDDGRDENIPVTPAAERTTFFSAGERKTESFIADPPADAVGYRFLVQAATRGAYVKNNGVSGNVTARLRSVEHGWNVDSRTSFVGAGQTELFEFNDTYMLLGEEWEITVEPAAD
ncbi:hypothetical protein [Natronobiforma cellulositropha]|uniref:hypothetical protein n=1 Tax=Natronobiforma cellulositropha TaxID=1679076 RepID=UPI0021D579E9|nr:hypothetical protein [Natronobiforma cellulositropha]